MSNPYAQHNQKTKASFDHVYDLPDPRGYFEALGSLDYLAPEHGRRVFPALLDALRDGGGEYPKVLDLCCSYGVNATLLKHDLILDDLYERYASKELADLSTEELVSADTEFYRGRLQAEAPGVVGVDVAAKAVSYALRVGLLDAGVAENLEDAEPSGSLRRAADGAGLVTVTGGVGYIWERTFERVLSACVADGYETPWVATLPVRFVDYAPIAAVLERWGLVTEKCTLRTFPQRRFADEAEKEHALRELAARGLDPASKEDAGWYHADLYLSRPAEEVAEVGVDELLGASGALDY